MKYNRWKLLDKIDVAIRTSPGKYTFTGYIVDHGDEAALEKAKDWARSREYDREKKEYTTTYEPEVHTFENGGFTARIIDSADGSSQGGRVSFWACEVEKDGVKFTIGVNDEILVNLIKSSDISNGVIKQKVMFARQSGQPGLIHAGMQMYKDAVADMEYKATMKAAKKTSKWEIGGVYSSITQVDICIGEVWDTLELSTEQEPHPSYSWSRRNVTKWTKREKPVKTTAWMHFYNYRGDKELPDNLTEWLKEELASGHIYFRTGKPPARAKTQQLEVKKSDMKLIDQLLAKKDEYNSHYSEEKVKGRYVRELK